MDAMSSFRSKELEIISGGNTGRKVKEIESKLSSAGDGALAVCGTKGKLICQFCIKLCKSFTFFSTSFCYCSLNRK